LQMEWGGWRLVKVRVNWIQARKVNYPLARLQISGFWKQMALSATQITGGRYNGEVKSTTFFANRWTGSSLITQLQDPVSITRI
jgi:hypothetical protein